VALLQISGCSERAEERFTVDPSLLGPVQTDSELRVRFQAPVQFQAADSVFLAQSRRALLAAGRTEPYEILPAMIFSIPASDARCFVSSFPNARGAVFDAAWREGYLNAAREKAGTNEFESELVARDENDILAVRVKGRGFLNQRFVCATPQGQILQVDYLLPDSLAKPLQPGIESSIGAMTFF
jgi:hypothetical protein